MKTVEATGLVPVRVLSDTAFLTYSQGDVFGLAPDKAAAMVAAGAVEAIDGVAAAPGAEPILVLSSEGQIVSVPPSWETAHHKTKMKLAQDIGGSPVPDSATATAVILAAIEDATKASV
jgi:hypothetical protein